ncbi:preprotein translocase subunit SecG [Limosilactobacillus fermentum]|nr:preprotein translocase subunit SecG [Limosilactobacillus fermentum]EEI22590.1 preprotein translocase, SecG subunit [Limosilactobacillus fermentum ATCC 14931]ARB01632.1 preprotein translocase subunit SecG [Limosilactobacillus fermentum]AUO28557.1 preprotein translocase subunit SecG [Limosilactobacillus fermentum]AWV31105.1 preprotein translocase subunit SecG [Limosilactobacillus fermentum]AXH08422.1 preprotein translocase subunit SecG [Limosilactobacillus fermentum]
MTLFLIDCVVMIACVMMQPAKNDNDSMSALTGGSGDLFSRRKARGFEAVMQIVTVIVGIIFFVLALALVYVSSH